jgi:YD repeat-containing protein
MACVVVSSPYLWAQAPQLPKVVAASPEASALAKYINYPVNHSAGLVDISIPLYEIKVGDMTLPITLSYHASGIKVNEKSGIVGLGWSLNAAPSVSRSMSGNLDEYSYLKHVFNPPAPGQDQLVYNRRLFESSGFPGGSMDEQPDNFYYKLLSGSGRFYIAKRIRSQDAPTFVTAPYTPIWIDNSKIVSIANNQSSVIDAFNMRDEKGVLYNFANRETSTIDFNAGYTSSWKATTITSPTTGQTLSFQYQPGATEIINNFQDMTVVQDNLSNINSASTGFIGKLMGCGGVSPISYPLIPRATECIGGSCHYRYWQNGNWVTQSGSSTTEDCYVQLPSGSSSIQVSTLRLKEINYTGGKVVIDMRTIANIGDCVDKIKIYSGTELIKQYVFVYETVSYTTSGNNQTPHTDYRLLLRSINMQDKNNVAVGKYQFDYNSTPLPDYLSKSVDYWGYYNGAANDYFKSFVPLLQIETNPSPYNAPPLGTAPTQVTVGSANREPSFGATQAMSLNKITYPTGGYTVLEYQPNQYKQEGQLKNAGGLRIHKVSENTPGMALQRTYTYGKQEDGAGLLRTPITNDAFSYEQGDLFFDLHPVFLTYYVGFYGRSRTFYSSALTDLFYNSGIPVFYDVVTEYNTDGSGNSLGKTVYHYKPEDAGGYGGHYQIPKTSIVIDMNTDWMFGQLLSKKVYKGNKATGVYDIVSSTGYNYGAKNYAENSIYVGKTYLGANLRNYDRWADGGTTNDYDYYNSVQYFKYNIPTGAMVLNSDTTIYYEGGTKRVDINEYTYDNNTFLSPTQIKTTDSEGRLLTLTQKYPHDITLTGDAETGRQKLITDWRVSTVLEQTQTKGTAVTKTRTDYDVFNGKAQPAAIVTNSGASLADEPRIVFDDYDANGNILTVSKKDDIRTCYLWGYNNLHPVAKIDGASYEEINATIRTTIAARTFASNSDYLAVKADIDFLKSQLASLLSDARYKVSLYTYFNNNLSAQTDANGVATYYEYDTFGRLQSVRDDQGNVIKTITYQYTFK